MQENENTSRTASEQTRTNRTVKGRDSGNPRTRRRPAGNSNRPVRKAQAKRRRQRNLIVKILLLILIVLIAIAGTFFWKKYSTSKEKADLKSYYGIEKENQLAIVLNNEVKEPMGMVSDGKAYLQYEFVHDYLNERFYWDPNENQLLYTLPEDIVSVGVGSTDYNVSKDKSSEDYVILKTEGSTAYIALEFVQKFTNIKSEVYENPDRVVIAGGGQKVSVATVKKDTQIRYRGGVKSPILTEVSKKDEVVVLEKEKNWTKVCSEDGFVGYIKKSALKGEQTKTIKTDFEEPEYTSIKKDYTINMVWHNVTNKEANSTVYERVAKTKGLTTICPTWYHVKDTKGTLQSISSSEYVDYAHQNNIEVWATIRDFDGGINSSEESLALLSSTTNRTHLINQLIIEALSLKIDGINVDFEKISEECGVHYIQFIRELSVKCRQNELVLSVDNYVPQNYNKQYNRKEQGVFADYVVIMGYDEHFGGSPEAGSVSSYNYVRDGIEATVEEVPSEKVISGLPFFTRLWKEMPKTSEEIAAAQGTENAQYTMNVSSEALAMTAAKNVVSKAGAKETWDDETKQNYASWEGSDGTYKIWIEDAKSMEEKLQLMKDNNLAGTAFWALGQESPDIWTVIQQYVN